MRVKIVTRKGSIVTVKNAEDFHISPSRQKAFIDLINVFAAEKTNYIQSVIKQKLV